ncbi:MAG: hypothetical protein ACLFWL_15130 [Candidatus Brocadiia bacterium]
MFKVRCINCGQTYKAKEELVGKSIKCPSCGMPIQIKKEDLEKGESDEKAVRQELLRLAGGKKSGSQATGAKSRPSSTGRRKETGRTAGKTPPESRKQAASSAAASQSAEMATAEEEPEDEEGSEGPGTRMDHAEKSYAGLIAALIVFLILGLGAVYGFIRYRDYQVGQAAAQKEEAADVRSTVANARKADRPYNEEEAIKLWGEAKQRAQNFEREYGGGKFMDVITHAGERIHALKTAQRQRERSKQEAQKLVRDAHKAIAEKQYNRAKRMLNDALQTARKVKKPGSELQKTVAEAQELLKSAPVKYGSKGWVKHEGEWMSKAERAKRIKEKVEQAKREQGLVKYDGEWMTPEEKAKREKEKAEKRTLAHKLASASASVKEQIASGEPKVTIDQPGQTLRWQQEEWANPVSMAIERIGEENEKWVFANFKNGPKNKWVISLKQRCDINKYDKFSVDFLPGETVKVALGIWTLPGYKLYESRQKMVRGDQKTTITYDLQAAKYKCKESKWRHRSKIKNSETVTRMSLFFYSRPKTPIRFRNIRLLKDEAEEARQ